MKQDPVNNQKLKLNLKWEKILGFLAKSILTQIQTLTSQNSRPLNKAQRPLKFTSKVKIKSFSQVTNHDSFLGKLAILSDESLYFQTVAKSSWSYICADKCSSDCIQHLRITSTSLIAKFLNHIQAHVWGRYKYVVLGTCIALQLVANILLFVAGLKDPGIIPGMLYTIKTNHLIDKKYQSVKTKRQRISYLLMGTNQPENSG